jgi:hypothetical protein
LRPGAERRTFWIWVAGITLLGAVLRFQALDSGLPHPRTRPDEEPILQHTALPARGEFNLDWGVYPSAYVYLCWLWGEISVRAGHRIGLLPSGDYATILRDQRSSLYHIDRALSALAGTATVLLLMVVAERTLGRGTSLAAGLLMATNFLHARDSHTFKPDVMLSSFIVITFACLVPLARRATARHGILAGAAVGAAMAMKYPGILLLVPLYVAAAMGSPARGWRRLVPMPAVLGGCVAALVFLLTSPDLVFSGESKRMLSKMVLILFPQIWTDWIPLELREAAARPFGPAVENPGWRAFLYHVRFSLWYGFGGLATVLAAPAVLWGFATRRPVAVLASTFFVAWYAVVGSSPHLYARYLTPVAPVLLLLEAGVLAALASRFRRPGLVLSLAVAAVAVQPLASTLAFNRIAAETDTRLLATRWLGEHATTGARVVVYGTVFWPYGAPQMPPGVQLVNVPPEAQKLEEERVQYVVTHDHELPFSRVDRAPLASLGPRLTLLAAFDPAVRGGSGAVFESADAYYIPFHGFHAVERPGPKIEIYRFE